MSEIESSNKDNIATPSEPTTPLVSSPTTPLVSSPTTPLVSSPTDIIANIIEQTFIDLLMKYLENEDMKKKIIITLTPEIASVINNIISLSPDTLTDIEKAMISIIKDGKIDTKDVPNLIVVIQRIYQIIYSVKDVKFDAKKRADITSTSLKYILHILVLERKIKIDEDKQGDFFIQTYYLIDSCVGLLSFPKSLKTKSCLKKLFG